MSTDLYWRPVDYGRHALSKQLKYAIAERFWDHDGTLTGSYFRLSANHIEYLNGIADATSNDEVRKSVKELLDAIKRYGEVEIWIE